MRLVEKKLNVIEWITLSDLETFTGYLYRSRV